MVLHVKNDFAKNLLKDISIGLEMFLIEMVYWKDLSITGYLWYFMRPALFFSANALIVMNSTTSFPEALCKTLGWSVFWYCATSTVQQVRRVRRFFRYLNVSILSFFSFFVVDLVFFGTWMLCLALVVNHFTEAGGIINLATALVILQLLLVFPILLFLGMLSINAIDFAIVFMFVPIGLLFLINVFDLAHVVAFLVPTALIGIFEDPPLSVVLLNFLACALISSIALSRVLYMKDKIFVDSIA